MLESMADLRDLANRYDVPEEDILLLSLNLNGVRFEEEHNRIRFALELVSRPGEEFYTIVAGRREESPFLLTDSEVRFAGQRVARVSRLENDDCVTGYFRCDGTVLTLNSNARSSCTGCAFCHTSLQDPSDPRLREMDDLDRYAHQLARKRGGLSEVAKVTVCTGCFGTEERALQHLTAVKDAFWRYGFRGQTHFISSVIRSEEALDYLAERLAPFHLTCSIECFARRSLLLRPSKARVPLDDFEAVFLAARRRGIDVNFTYVAGLDEFDTMVAGFRRFAPLVTLFPLINGFQPHTASQNELRASGAESIEFYLRARREIEALFLPTGLRPRSWECYRPFWFFEFAGEELHGPRI